MKFAPLTLAWRVEAATSFDDLVDEAHTRIPGELVRNHAHLVGDIDWRIDEPGIWPPHLDGPYGVLVAHATIRQAPAGTLAGWMWHTLNDNSACLPCRRAHTRALATAKAALIS